MLRFEDIALLLSGRDLEANECNNDKRGLPYLIGASNIVLKQIQISRWTEFAKVISERGDILLSCKGTVGEIVLNTVGPIHIARQFMAIRSFQCVNAEYVELYIRAIVEKIKAEARGVIPGISREDIILQWIALPPVQEQKKIVDVAKQLLSFVDSISMMKENLTSNICKIKNKILDLAISGKLVTQCAEDKPAIELLKRINPDYKPCDTSHYENLPKGWSVATISDLCYTFNGLWKGKKEPFINVGVIRNANFTKDFKLDYSKIEYIDVEERQFATRKLNNGDLIVEKSGGSDNNPVGRAIIYEGQDEIYSLSNFTMALRVKDKTVINSTYLYYYILSRYLRGDMRMMQTQTTGLHNLILDKYLSMQVALPPLNEQNRIVSSILRLFNLLNSITAEL